MKFNDKILNFCTAITNVYKSEENQEFIQQMKLDNENITEDFTAMIFAINIIFNKITGQDVDAIDFTRLMNKLVFQHLMDDIDDHPTEKGGVE